MIFDQLNDHIKYNIKCKEKNYFPNLAIDYGNFQILNDVPKDFE